MTSSTAKDTDSEDDQRSLPTEADSEASTSRAIKAKRKLGKIGIRSKKQTPNNAEEDNPAHKPVPEDASGQTESPFKKHKHKLGKIGSKARTGESRDKPKESLIPDTSNPSHSNESFSKSQHNNTGQALPKMEQDSHIAKKSMVQNNQEIPGKISDMQANENRERLKRELDAKSSNAKRKKRKF